MRTKILKNLYCKLIIPILLIIVFTSCASNKQHIDMSEDVLLKDGRSQIEDEDYEKAEASFKKLLEDYPDSKLRVKAQMGLADSLYNQEKYDEAAFQYQTFIEIYPADKNIDKAHFYKGMSYFNQKKSIDRDQSYIHNAMEEFQYIILNYPESEYYGEAQKNIIICREDLAGNLLHIGKFYYRTGAFHSAIGRFQEFLDIYPDQKFADKALFYLGKSYMRRESVKKAVDIFKNLIVKFPQSEYVKKCKKIINDNPVP